MKIRIIGGGPAGLCFAALMKRDDPAHDIAIYERGPREATWGFGLVFSDRALEFLRADDDALYRLLSPHMETWPNLTIVNDDTRIPISGNGFAAIGCLQLLSLLYAHAEGLGVRIEFDIPAMSTFLVEVEEETWKHAGFERMSAADTTAYCEGVFAKDLEGHPILSNNLYWRNFPAIWNERWSFDNVVLLGDALRTVHFSIGSGTRLAMEDAIALWKAIREGRSVPEALALFQERRLPPMKKIWDAANVSLRWYERMGENIKLDPVEFAYSYMTRAGRVNHAEVRRRDPSLAGAYERLHPEANAS